MQISEFIFRPRGVTPQVFGRTLRLTFSTTSVLFQQPKHPLYRKVDWSKVDAGHYACVDPIDSHAILYLTERAYQVQVRVSLSQDAALVVLARPGDQVIPSPTSVRPSGPTIRNPTDDDDDSSKNSPILRISKASSPKWRGFLNWHLSSLGKLTGAKRRASDSSVSVAISVETLKLLVPYWGLDLHYRLGGNLQPPRSLIRALRSMAELMARRFQTRGPQDLIVTLKGAKFHLERYLAGNKDKDPWLLGSPVGLAKSGIPRLIPVFFRRGIVAKDTRVIRLIESLLNIYKTLEGSHQPQDLASVLGKCPELDETTLRDFRTFCKEEFWPKVIRSYVPRGARQQVFKPDFAIKDKSPVYIPTRAGPNAKFGLFGATADAIAWHLEVINYPLEWCKHVGDERTLKLFNRVIKKLGGPQECGHTYNEFLRSNGDPIRQVITGKLELLPEPAGKVRTIAIVDYWTQRLMSPVHDWMMGVLSHLPTDGTFDQDDALRSFARRVAITGEETASIDLKSATDLIPIPLYEAVFKGIWPDETVELWIALLTDRRFLVPKKDLVKRELRGLEVEYGRGQPMGTLSSWPSMALVHHALELFAAKRAGFDPTLFVDYRVLGDDNVTGNGLVTQEYLSVTTLLCVPTSLAKTIFGNLFIFASRVYRGLDDLSPLSLKEELGIRSHSQRLEMALRAVSRGWLEGKRTIAGFLRHLLSQKDYKSQTKKWCRGQLGKITQSALVSAFGISSRRILSLLGFQGSGFEPFFLALQGKVQAISQRPEQDRAWRPSSFELAVAIATAETLVKELTQLHSKLRVAGIRFRMWNDAVVDNGFLPRSTYIQKAVKPSAPELPGILAIPQSNWKTGLEIAKDFKYMPYKDSTGVLRYTDIFTPQQSVMDVALWQVIKDSYKTFFGKATIDPSISDFDLLDAEDSGTGVTLATTDTRVYTSGQSTTVPGIESQIAGARERAQQLLDKLVKAKPDELGSPLFVLEELSSMVSHIKRVPDFTGIASFYAIRKDHDVLTPFVRRYRLLSKVLSMLPLSGAESAFALPAPDEVPELPVSPREAALVLEGSSLQAAAVGHKTNQGLLTGFTNSIARRERRGA